MNGCSVQKIATQEQETAVAANMGQKSAIMDSLVSERESRMMEETLEHRSLRIETQSAVPVSETSLTLTTESLRNLPEGAEYTSSYGQASVSVRKTGDSLTVTGRCDSIARRCTVLESETLRRKTESDSLRRELDKTRHELEKADSTYRTEYVLSGSEVRKGRSGLFAWFSSGFLAGIASALAVIITVRRKSIIK